jgi:hypothetical protein
MTATGFALPILSPMADPRSIAERVNAAVRRENVRRPLDGRIFGFRGDGSDETARFQAAADAATAERCRVLLPPGRFTIASTITLSGQASFVGNDWGTVLVPASDGIGTLFDVSGDFTELCDLMVDASAIATPSFTAFHYDSHGLNRMDNVRIYGAGTGIALTGANASRFTRLRLEQCATGVRTGGTAAKFPGDTSWDLIDILTAPGGTGWIMDGNTNAQYLRRVLINGGARCLQLGGAGAGTGRPDGIFIEMGNFTASTACCVEITRATNVTMDSGTYIGGSTGGEGLLIDAAVPEDVDGVNLAGTHVRGNAREGVRWTGGANFSAVGAKIHGNSQAAANTFDNMHVGAGATGLCQVMGCMMGLSNTLEVYGNIANVARRAIELDSGALTTTGSFHGALMLVGNVFRGCASGTYLDNSAPAGADKMIASNL